MPLLNPLIAPTAFMLETPGTFLLVSRDGGECPKHFRSHLPPLTSFRLLCTSPLHELLPVPQHHLSHPHSLSGPVTEPLRLPDLQDTFASQSLSRLIVHLHFDYSINAYHQ